MLDETLCTPHARPPLGRPRGRKTTMREQPLADHDTDHTAPCGLLPAADEAWAWRDLCRMWGAVVGYELGRLWGTVCGAGHRHPRSAQPHDEAG
jgi:hypothetical protein